MNKTFYPPVFTYFMGFGFLPIALVCISPRFDLWLKTLITCVLLFFIFLMIKKTTLKEDGICFSYLFNPFRKPYTILYHEITEGIVKPHRFSASFQFHVLVLESATKKHTIDFHSDAARNEFIESIKTKNASIKILIE